MCRFDVHINIHLSRFGLVLRWIHDTEEKVHNGTCRIVDHFNCKFKLGIILIEFIRMHLAFLKFNIDLASCSVHPLLMRLKGRLATTRDETSETLEQELSPVKCSDHCFVNDARFWDYHRLLLLDRQWVLLNFIDGLEPQIVLRANVRCLCVPARKLHVEQCCRRPRPCSYCKYLGQDLPTLCRKYAPFFRKWARKSKYLQVLVKYSLIIELVSRFHCFDRAYIENLITPSLRYVLPTKLAINKMPKK